MGQLIGLDSAAPYPERIHQLMKNRIALWDVLYACERAGSLDQHIIQETETPNKLPELLSDHPEIDAIAFNGAKSWQAFKRHLLPRFSDEWMSQISLLILPSTSPANAGITFQDKLIQWQKLLPYLDQSTLQFADASSVEEER